MGSFQQGFALGSQMWDEAEKSKYFKEAAERERLKFEREQKAWQDQDSFNQGLAEESKLRNYEGGERANEALGGNLQMSDVEKKALLDRLSQLQPEQQRAAYNAYVNSNLGTGGAGGQQQTAMGAIYRDKNGTLMVAPEGQEGTLRTADEYSTRLADRMQSEGNAYGIEKSQQLRKGALDLRKGEQDIAVGAETLAAAKRTNERAKAEDELSQWVMEQTKEIQADPVGWSKKNLGAYNNPEKGSVLDDGMTAEIVQGIDAQNRPVYTFVQRDKDGRSVMAAPVNPQTAMLALERMALSRYAALPGKFKEGIDIKQKEREIGVKEGELGVHKDFYGKGGVYETNADANRQSNERIHKEDRASRERVAGMELKGRNQPSYQYAGQDSDGVTVRYDNRSGDFSRADGKPIKDPSLIKKFGAVAEWKYNTDGNSRRNEKTGDVENLDSKTGNWIPVGQPTVSANAANLGVVAQKGQGGQWGYRGAKKEDGTYRYFSTEEEAAASVLKANKDNKNSPASSASALPTGGVKPTYDGWMAAKSKRDDLLSTANKMSPDRREVYLQSRLPEIEREIEFHSKYSRY